MSSTAGHRSASRDGKKWGKRSFSKGQIENRKFSKRDGGSKKPFGRDRSFKKSFQKTDKMRLKKAHKKGQNKMDYKSLVITGLLKVLKKLKAFTVRKILRNIKQIEEGDEHYKGKETKEELEAKVELIKLVKNHEIKAMIPLLIAIDLKDQVHKYWPVLESMVISVQQESYN